MTARNQVESTEKQLRVHSEERREQVIDAAIRVFYSKGYRAATIQDIANELGFTGAALYYYVKSKQDLLVEVIQEPSRRLIAMTERVAAENVRPIEKLRMIIGEHLKIMLRNKELFSILLRERIELPPEKAEQLAQLDRDYYDAVKNQVRDAMEVGELKSESPEVVTLALLGMVNWTLLWYREDRPLQDQDIADIFFRIFYEGTAPDEARAEPQRQ